MRLLSFLAVSFFIGLFLLGTTSCKKEKLLTNGGELKFSRDTINFDTVFTQFASFTIGVKIFNPQNQKVNVSSIRLAKGTTSFFHLNINGESGNEAKDVELAANDSLYVFATVKIDPTNQNNPFIIEDNLVATLNGQDFSIPLFAYGQNVHYITDSVIKQNTTWLTDKPYVILHSALVDKGATLTMPPGCRVYMHADSRLYVLGKLIANGTKQDSIIFQGDRLDRDYFGNEGYPGEWGGIYFDSSSTGNQLSWAVIRNCGNNSGGGLPFAVEVYGKSGIANQLTMKNTIIENSIGYGLLCFNSNVQVENSLIHLCGAQALALFQGGNYQFNNCDFIIYNPPKLAHNDNPTVAVLNYFAISNTQYIAANMNADFKNCVIYGSLQNELFCDKVNDATYQTSFTNSFIKNKEAIPSFVSLSNCQVGSTALPDFKDITKQNYRLTATSSLVDAGVAISALSNDLDDKPRQQGAAIDIGCYEFQP